MMRRASALLILLLLPTHLAYAQTTVESSSPTLAELLQNIYGRKGLIVDSDAVLPDGSTHSAHFNGAFQSEFRQINVALVRQLGALPIPSPASGLTYTFDTSTGTFVRTTESFGPILAERAETIGRGRFNFGYSFQYFDFTTFDGLSLTHIPAVFTHDDFQLGGGRSDVITTVNSIRASVSQSAFSLTYGITDRIDVSLGVPVIRTVLRASSDAEIHRIGTGTDSAIHFFRDPDASGSFGDERLFIASGSATGLGDIIVRGKGTVVSARRASVAVGAEARLPSGDEANLLGSGAFGLKLFGAMSMGYGRLSPHVNVAYQWNNSSVLAGDVANGTKGDIPDELSYVVGADFAVDKRLTLAAELLGRHSPDSPRLSTTTFAVPANPAITFRDISFTNGSLNVLSGAFGMKAAVAGSALLTFNLHFKLNDAGVRARVTPLVGLEYGF
jgi:hypothetical protein